MEKSTAYRVREGVVIASRYIAVTLGISAAICVAASNFVHPSASDALMAVGYVVFGFAAVALVLMLVANWLGWSDEEMAQGYQGAKRPGQAPGAPD